jgi:multidrug efflux pump
MFKRTIIFLFVIVNNTLRLNKSQAHERFQQTIEAIEKLYVHTQSGEQVPLSTVVKISQEVVPNELTQFQQLNSATIDAIPMHGAATIADAHAYLTKTLREIAPIGFIYDFGGQSRQFEKEGSALLMTFVLALLVIYLVLSAQFESFRDPFVVLITLIGLISKHGILIVEFSNQLQRQGRDKVSAVKEAAALRLRPILMTTAAMLLGVMPLVLASGAGAVSRNNIGLLITVGLTIGTLFTLFVVPVMYTLIAKQYNENEEIKRLAVTQDEYSSSYK